MQLGSVRLSTGSEGSGKRVDNALVEHDGSTHYRQLIVLAGASTMADAGDVVEPGTTAPSSAVWGLPVRIASNSSGNLIGSAIVSTGAGLGSVDPRTRSWTLSTGEAVAVVAGSTIDVRAVASSSVAFATLLSTASNSSYLDPRARTWTLSTGESVGIVAGSTLDVRVVGGGSSGVVGAMLISTGLGGAAIDPRQISAGSTLDVRVIGAGSSAVIGTILISTGLGGAAIDPRGTLTASSSQTFPTQLSTGPDGAYYDARQSTIVAATSGAGLGTILSTGVGGPAIDARARTWTLSTGESIAVVGAGSSSHVFGQVFAGSTWPVAVVSAGSSVTVGVVAGSTLDVRAVASSSVGFASLLSTAANSTYYDARTRSWTLSTGDIPAGISLSSGQVFILATTALPSSDAMAYAVRPVMGSSATVIGAVALLAGTTANTVGAAALVAGSSANIVGSVALVAGTTATVGGVQLAPGSTATVIGTVALSSGAGVRSYMDSTGNYTQKFFYTTGIAAPTASTMQSLHQVTNFTSGSSGFSFNVAAGRVFRIEYVNMTLRGSSGASLYADFAIRATASTAGTTGTTPPVFYQRLTVDPPTTAAIAGGAYLAVTDLTIDLPSTGSYGVSIVANSSVTNECLISFGGVEYTI